MKNGAFVVGGVMGGIVGMVMSGVWFMVGAVCCYGLFERAKEEAKKEKEPYEPLDFKVYKEEK